MLRSLRATSAAVGPSSSTNLVSQTRNYGFGPVDARIIEAWERCYPAIMKERHRDMYHCYYPYLFDHGDKMSLYPKIPSNPREWQPSALQTTYDAIREDKYDAFVRLRKKFPETYEDTQNWDNPQPYGQFNMFYSVRFGMIGCKVATTVEYDDLGNKLDCTVLWCPDNQIVSHGTTTGSKDNPTHFIQVGAMNVPIEYHKPYVTSFFKSQRVPPKQVTAKFAITPDAYVPVGTKLDVRHFKVGQEIDCTYQYTDFGIQGVMFKTGADGGAGLWLGDSKWARRIGGLSSEGAKRTYPGSPRAGYIGGFMSHYKNCPIFRIDYKNQLIVIAKTLECDIGAFIKLVDVPNIKGKVSWNAHRGFPEFPTFIPPEDEDLSTMSTEECNMTSPPLYNRLMDEDAENALISATEAEDAKKTKPEAAKKTFKFYDLRKFQDYRKEFNKARRAARKKSSGRRLEKVAELQEAARQAKKQKSKKVKK